MSLIVGPSAAVNWTLTRERICDKALEKLGILAAGEAAKADDRSLCIEALEGILKNLLWRGYAWPKTISSKANLTLVAATANTALPADFYDVLRINYLDAGSNEIPLPLIDNATYTALVKKTEAANYPLMGYIDNFNVLWTYPVQSANVTAYLYYQQVINDTVAASSVDLDSPWLMGLPFGVAAHVGDEFGVPEKKLLRFAAIWEQQLQLGIMNESAPGPACVSVDD